MSPKELKKIRPVIQRIVKGYAPQKIILFGSRAWGSPTEDSDYDFVIIKKGKTKKNYFSELRKVRSFIGGEVAVDVLLYAPKEFDERVEEGDLFLRNILKKGKLLYEQ